MKAVDFFVSIAGGFCTYVAMALVATWGLARAGVAAWWLLPLATMALLWISLVRAAPTGRGR